MNPIAASIALILLLAGCASRPASSTDDAELVGMTITAAMEATGVKRDMAKVIEEPPGVPRGVSGEDARGAVVELYVRRGAVPMSVKRDWEISAFLDQSVIGVARKTQSGWEVTGEVMMIRAQSTAATKNNQ
jgi:hypothetical protein